MRNQCSIVSFKFDDFPRSAVSNGARILQEHSTRGTFCVAGSYCGQLIDGVRQYDETDLKALVLAGNEIGCHTFHHQRVSTLNAKALAEELDRNAAFVKRHCPKVALNTFAYPHGDVSLWSTLKLERRFEACRSSDSGLNRGTVDLGTLVAVRLYDRLITPEEVSRVIRQATIENASLIFYTHDVDEAPSGFGCTPAVLEYAVSTAICSGAVILPVCEAIAVARR